MKKENAMALQATLVPAQELASRNTTAFPNESLEYRTARNALLAEEIELRRHIERVAALRRALPLGGEVPENYVFQGDQGPIRLRELFNGKQTLIIYSFMFGPQRERPCPVCTSLLSAWDGSAQSVEEQAALVVVARSPIERLMAFRQERGWQHLRLYSDGEGAYTRTYVNAEDADMPALNVFTRINGKVHHFWSGEISGEMADPGQDPRGAPDIDPLWTILDLTPEGRGATWYPRLDYAPAPLLTLG